MTIRSHSIAWAKYGFLLTLAFTPLRGQQPAVDSAKETRLRWFREAKYGLFIHWGLYAIPAGEWKGQTIPGIGEWIMNRAQIPVVEYSRLAKQFNPVKFDADAWVKLAKDAGMKYIVITSKHHDGFALFKSKASPFNVVDATPFKRDVLKELAAACAKQGIRLGFYYSQSQDWHEPNGAGNTWDFGADSLKSYDTYLRGKAEPQVRELLTGYGPVALIWFDTPRMMIGDRASRFTQIVRSMQPNTLIDGRLGESGDYLSTGDNVIPGTANTQAWEVPATLNHTWGYRKDDHDWKSPGEVIFKLVDVASKGGNYLLNVGPMANGEMPKPAQDVLRAAGAWLKVNGDAVYGTWATPFGEELGEPSAKGTKDLRGQPLFLSRNEYRVTAKPGKLYFTFFAGPRVPFALPRMQNVVTRAYRLADHAEVEIRDVNGEKQLQFNNAMMIDPLATVVVVEIEGDRAVTVASAQLTRKELIAIERHRVIEQANRYLTEQPVTITATRAPRGQGGPHDFYSEGDYWWPDPSDSTKPYLRRDGETNPANFDAHRAAMRRLSMIVPALVAAYQITGDERYTRHAVAHLRAWFVDAGTRMNPTMLYAQAIQGVAPGRGIGIIDTIHLVEVAQAALVLERLDVFPRADLEGTKNWFRQYVAWMTTHKYGLDERNNGNNHSAAWALQVAAFSRFTGDSARLAEMRTFFKETLIPGQMSADGSFALELARTKPYGYSLFQLDVMGMLAETLATPRENLWTFATPDGRGMRRALAFMVPYIADKSKWPKPADVMYDDAWPVRHPSLLFGGLALHEATYVTLWQRLNPDPTIEEVIRNYPVRQPLLWMQ